MKPLTTANRFVWSHVQSKTAFTNTNKTLFGNYVYSGIYVVYSYGSHFPIYAYEPKSDRWFANEDKYSRTTTRHQSLAHPRTETYPLSSEAMRELVNHADGYERVVVRRLAGCL